MNVKHDEANTKYPTFFSNYAGLYSYIQGSENLLEESFTNLIKYQLSFFRFSL